MRGDAPIRVVVADDHRIFREGLCAVLSRCPAVKVVGQARNGEEAVLLTRRKNPDILLLDLDMPILDGIAVTRILTGRGHRPKILMLSCFEDEARVQSAMQAGAVGYVTKRVDTGELVEILKATVTGRASLSPSLSNLALSRKSPAGAIDARAIQLTAKERETLDLLAQGYSNREIAGMAHMSCDTVKAYLKTIFGKLQVRNRTQAAVVALRSGILTSSNEAGPAMSEATGRADVPMG